MSDRRPSRGGSHNYQPSWAQRLALRAYCLAVFGDGISAPCQFCGKALLFSAISLDLHPLPARKGGRYKRGNVRPACLSCNVRAGAREAALERAKAKAQREARNARRRERYAARRCAGL